LMTGFCMKDKKQTLYYITQPLTYAPAPPPIIIAMLLIVFIIIIFFIY
jgi:hypothetical protein